MTGVQFFWNAWSRWTHHHHHACVRAARCRAESCLATSFPMSKPPIRDFFEHNFVCSCKTHCYEWNKRINTRISITRESANSISEAAWTEPRERIACQTKEQRQRRLQLRCDRSAKASWAKSAEETSQEPQKWLKAERQRDASRCQCQTAEQRACARITLAHAWWSWWVRRLQERSRWCRD